MSSPDYGTYKAGERENGRVIYVRDRGRAAQIYFTWGEQKKPQQHLSTKEKERWGKRWTRLESREMKVRKKVRGNIGNNVLSVVEIKFSISSRKHKDTHNCTHLQLSPSGWDCVIWHIHFLGWVCLRCCRGSHNPHRGILAIPWMMSLSKHTRWTANKSRSWKRVSLITAPPLSHPFPFSPSCDSCHRKFGLISSSLQVTECRGSLTPFFLLLQFPWSSPFGPWLNYVALHRAMYPKLCPWGH